MHLVKIPATNLQPPVYVRPTKRPNWCSAERNAYAISLSKYPSLLTYSSCYDYTVKRKKKNKFFFRIYFCNIFEWKEYVEKAVKTRTAKYKKKKKRKKKQKRIKKKIRNCLLEWPKEDVKNGDKKWDITVVHCISFSLPVSFLLHP